MLGQPRYRPLERMRVQVGHARHDRPLCDLGTTGSRPDRNACDRTALVVGDQDIAGPAVRQPSLRSEQFGHRTPPEVG